MNTIKYNVRFVNDEIVLDEDEEPFGLWVQLFQAPELPVAVSVDEMSGLILNLEELVAMGLLELANDDEITALAYELIAAAFMAIDGQLAVANAGDWVLDSVGVGDWVVDPVDTQGTERYVQTLWERLPGDDPVPGGMVEAIIQHYAQGSSNVKPGSVRFTGAYEMPLTYGMRSRSGYTHLVGLNYTAVWDGEENPEACALYGLDAFTGSFELYTD